MATAAQQRKWYDKNRQRWNQYQRERYRRLHPLTTPRELSLEQRFALIDKRVSRMGIRELEEISQETSI